MSGPRIVAVVPAFQEEAAIGGVVEEIRRFDPAIDVVVVDDGSGDTTAEAAAAAGATVVRLGSEVLRTSTAGVVAVASVLARTPRWR